MKLITRFILQFAILITLVVGSAIALTYWLGERQAETGSNETLENSKAVQHFFHQYSLREIELLTASMAAESAFVSYISEALSVNDTNSIEYRSAVDLLTERISEYGFEYAAVFNLNGTAELYSSENPPLNAGIDQLEAIEEVIATFEYRSGILVIPDRVLIYGAVPMIRGRTMQGVLVTVQQLNPSVISDIATVSGADLSYLSLPGGTPQLSDTTLDQSTASQLEKALIARPAITTEVMDSRNQQSFTLELNQETWQVVVAPLGEGMSSGLLVSLVPRNRLFSMFTQIFYILIGSGIVALIIGIMFSAGMARNFVKPLKNLTTAAREAVRGEYPNRISLKGKSEILDLEKAFNQLVVELREQQALETWFRDILHIRPDGAPGNASHPSNTAGDRALSSGLVIGNTIGGRYHLLKEMGKGAMGIVFQAHDRDLDEVVALKVLRPSMSQDSEKIERLKAEIRLARRITHPNVVRTYDFVQFDGIAAVSMEFIEGVTLRQAIDETGRVNYYTAMRLARQICAGLAAAHKAGVLHRDVKPGNIILHYGAKVMDFGIAHPASRPFSGPNKDGYVEGTPEVMSPEQIAGKNLDVRSDIYSLGVVLMEMFTGHLPHQGTDTMETIVSHLKYEPVKPSTHWPDIPKPLEALILKCLRKSRSKRYQTVEDVSLELTRISTL